MEHRIADNYRIIADRVAAAALRSGRPADAVGIVAVSKTFPVEDVQNAINAGIRVFGENRVQEARDKIPQLTGDFTFHLVGHLQSNKAKEAVKLFSLIHSVDSVSLAQKLSLEAAKLGGIQDILIQVNTSGEESKSGIEPAAATELAAAVITMENLRLRGLMTIGPLEGGETAARKSFVLLRELRDRISGAIGQPLPELSMGMSGDFEAAIEEGSTLVRIGSAIFGSR